MSLYADLRVQMALKQRFAYIFETENKYPGAPNVVLNTVDKTTSFDLGGKPLPQLK